MATTDQNITELPIKTASEVSDADYLMGIDLVEGYQVLTKDFADYAVNRAAISIGGKTQTTASALSEVRTTANNAQPKVSGKGLSTNDYTTAEKNKLSGIAAGAEVNQNAFSNVKVGSTTIAADGKTDTLELVAGENITLTPDATNDKVTIKAAKTVYTGTSPITVTNKAIGLSNSGVSAGTYKSVTVDAKGRVTAGTNPSTISGYGITDAYTKTAIDEKLDIEAEESADANPVTVETTSAQLATRTHLTFAPQQDLHGYEHPWPVGGGKNKLNFAHGSETRTVQGVTFTTYPDGTVVANGTNTSSATGAVLYQAVDTTNLSGNYYFVGGYDDKDDVFFWDSTTGARPKKWDGVTNIESSYDYTTLNEIQIVDGHSLSVAFRVGAGQTANNVVFRPMLLLSTETDPTFEPYSNICPISGLDTAEVKRTGVNLWDENWVNGYYASNTGVLVIVSGVATLASKNHIAVDADSQYYAYFGKGDSVVIFEYTANGTFIGRKYIIQSGVFTTTADTASIAFHIPNYGNGRYDSDVSINNPSTVTTYEPYQESIVETPLPETVYGGTLDLETGELVVDRAMHHVSDFTWVAGNAGWWYTSSVTDKAVGLANVFSDKYLTSDSASVSDMPENSVRGNASYQYIYIRNSSYATLADFTTGEANTQLVYELATPITYILTPKQLALLKGVNHISTNASTVKVTFRAGQLATLEDVAGAVEIADEHIETALAPILGDFANIETSPAASNHAVGEYLIHDSKLYKVIAAITAGESLTEGTNIGRTTVAAELASLGNGVDLAYSLTVTNNNVIPQNSDANDYYYRGIYVVPSISIAQTIANLPIAGGGKLLVEDILVPDAATLTAMRVLQTYFVNRAPNQIYRRYWGGSAWSAWYKFEGTAIS